MLVCNLLSTSVNSCILKRLNLKYAQLLLKNTIHKSVSLTGKLYVDQENIYAHDILQKSLQKYEIFNISEKAVDLCATTTITLTEDVLKPPENAFNLDINVLYNNFCDLTNYCIVHKEHISQIKFTPCVEAFCDASHKLSDEQLLHSLRQIALLPEEENTCAHNFMQLWNTLDVECCNRLEQWKTPQILLIADAWYYLKLARVCEYVRLAIRKLGRKLRRMSKEHMVQTMFLCNLIRYAVYEMHDFELNLERYIDELTLNELSVMSMGFFKTQTPLRNPDLIAKIYKRVLNEIDTVQDISLVALLKILRYSSKIPHAENINELLIALKSQLPRLSLISCLHIALLGSNVLCCNDEVLEQIFLRFELEIDQTRLKDLERICLVIELFNIKTLSNVEQRLCKKILEILSTRIDEILKYPRCFSNCLHYLSVCGFYDTEMISSVLNKKFLLHAYGNNFVLGREIFSLDGFVKINLLNSNYNGYELEEKYRCTMGKVLTHYIPERNTKYKLSTTDRTLLEIKETTENLCQFATFKHILPHFERPDIVICFDRHKKAAIPLAKHCPADYTGKILRRQELLENSQNEHMDTVVIVVAGWNNMIREKNRYTGLFAYKLQQLQLLGHKFTVIPWYEWREQETANDQTNLIQRKLAKIIPI